MTDDKIIKMANQVWPNLGHEGFPYKDEVVSFARLIEAATTEQLNARKSVWIHPKQIADLPEDGRPVNVVVSSTGLNHEWVQLFAEGGE